MSQYFDALVIKRFDHYWLLCKKQCIDEFERGVVPSIFPETQSVKIMSVLGVLSRTEGVPAGQALDTYLNA